jgi:hypothetical protein
MVGGPACDQADRVPTRIALLDLPGLLADVVLAAFREQPGLEVGVLPPGSTPQGVLAGRPDVVMIGVADPQHYAPAEELLRRRPGLGLFAISFDARQAWIHELRPSSRPLAEVSAASLRAAVVEFADGARP